jgi:vancomycin aglycone glucosyltransferase
VGWVQGFGFDACPVGVEMRFPAARSGQAAAPLTAEQIERLRESMPDLITDQFEKVEAAAAGCDVILGANAHQYAARSIAEILGIPYVTALYAPVAIPSPDHAPPPAPGETWTSGDAATNLQRWADNRKAWNDRALARVNHNRTQRGLAPIYDVLGYNITDKPWLATDEALAPIPHTPGFQVFDTGAWLLPDATPLSPDLAAFLKAGEPPIYFGFGSMPAPSGMSQPLIMAARACGRRVIVSQGWAEVGLIDDAPDGIAIGDINLAALFPHVAAAVHHGGAGTTATAARAGVPQVVIPMFGDQFYWASRVQALGIGTSLVGVGSLTEKMVASALREVLEPDVAWRAQSIVANLRHDGALVAARRLVAL